MADDTISFEGAVVPVGADVMRAHAEYWRRLSAPGTWWNAAERVAIAAETRAARECVLCAERRHAVSANAVPGQHDRPASGTERLSDAAIEAVHRTTTDATRLTGSFIESLSSNGLDDAHYVELLGIVVAVTSIDFVCRGLGAMLHTLPAPTEGEPTRYRPAEAVSEGAFVPMIPVDGLGADERDLWQGRTGNVIRAMSLVPDAVRDLNLLGEAHYVPADKVTDPTASRTLARPQMELVAGRVSALNECFY